jgi:sulfur carrier protein ThiS
MLIHVRLHGHLRDVLPLTAKGRTTVTLPEKETIVSLIKYLGLSDQLVSAAVNDAYESDLNQVLEDGDSVNFFAMVGGGS